MITRKIYYGIFILSFLVGCNNPDSTPELRDPIYLDLKNQEAASKKASDAKLKELQEFEEKYAELPDNDYQKKLLRSDIYKTKNEIAKLKQMEAFYKISSESRQIFARKQYLEYFKAGKEWPPPKTQENYAKYKELMDTPKRWTRGAASKKPPKAEKKPESKH